MTGVGQGKTQPGDFWSRNPNWIFMLAARKPYQSQLVIKRTHNMYLKAHEIIGVSSIKLCVLIQMWKVYGQRADRANESNSDLSNLRSKYLRVCHRPLASWLSGGYFYDYGLNALPGIACRGCHSCAWLPTYSCVQGRVSLGSKHYSREKFFL